MFLFSRKKNFLADLLPQFVDIHNHILPGIDDGAQNLEESIALLRGFAELGITNVVCTPHIMHNYYQNTPKTIQKSYTSLKRELDRVDFNSTSIRSAAEHMIDANFDFILEENEIMPLGEHYLLVEMSFLQPPLHFEASTDLIRQKGYYPILAHPERYLFLHEKWKTYLNYKESGILYQVNLLSLGGYYGSSVTKMAVKLLEHNLVDFVGTDIHNSKQLEFLKNIKLNTKVSDMVRSIVDRTIETFY